MNKYFENIVKKASGLYKTPAQEFTTINVPNSAYVKLYNDVLNSEYGQHTIEVDVGDYILFVKVFVTISSVTTTGGTDDYGNREMIYSSSIDVEVLDYYMIDDDCEHINCDFDSEEFEQMFN